ncbi:MAG: hypothetical protein SV583_01375 [Pseudomonadota bacterium]|nr:hypothetical protein [Pseudomonadota bacterium]
MAEATIHIRPPTQLPPTAGEPTTETAAAQRHRWSEQQDGLELSWLCDRFSGTAATVWSLRISTTSHDASVDVCLPEAMAATQQADGSWLLVDQRGHAAPLWIPCVPQQRRIDDKGQIEIESNATLSGWHTHDDAHRLRFHLPGSHCLDLVYWVLDGIEDLQSWLAIREAAALALHPWGSHQRVQSPQDFYLHWVHGHVYENRRSWPNYRRICSENDAHALYVIARGWELADSPCAALLRHQMVLSILDRQSPDGGWYHGFWTDELECHYRLHCSAIHCLLDHWTLEQDNTLLPALQRAVAFIVGERSTIDAGVWFLHDSLEQSAEAMAKSPFKWTSSTALGKQPGNMLVLNTQIDTLIALLRHQAITGDSAHAAVIASAERALQAVLQARPMEPLYRLVSWILGLDMQPEHTAAALPLPMRAIKRFGWKYLAPRLHRLKSRWPRLVMPNGYIDRALSIQGTADAYQSINLMDLARLRPWSHCPGVDEALEQGIAFTQTSGLLEHWREQPKKAYALVFWAETLFHLCGQDPDPALRSALADALRMLHQSGIGLPPSVLGGNAEAGGGRHRSAAAIAGPADWLVVPVGTGEELVLVALEPAASSENATPQVPGYTSHLDASTAHNGNGWIALRRLETWQ